MRKAETLGVSVLRGTAEVTEDWPGPDGQWTAMAVWRQEPVGAALVGRRLESGEVFYDVVVCQHDEGEWHVVGSGGSSVDPTPTSLPAQAGVHWFFSQDIQLVQDDEEAYVWTAVGATSDGRPTLTGTIRQELDDELPIRPH
jgi:hypothetical protein